MLRNSNSFNAPTFKDHRQERKILVSRSLFAFVVVTILMLTLLVRSWYLQVIKHEDYQTRSNNNRISVQRVAPNRGLIYDRNGILLAENRSIYSLELIPEQVANLDRVLDRIKALGLVKDKHIKLFYERLLGVRRFKSVLIKSRLSEEDVAIFSANGHQLKGVRVEARLVRFYPYGDKVVHALGSVRRINNQDLLRIDQTNYRATRYIGKVGIEKHYEHLLHGKIGSRTVETDVQGRVIGRAIKETPPIPGRNIKLSLDIDLQLVAAKAIGNFRGAVIAIDPRNGEVLALVSNPGYDPNDFVTGISTENYAKLTDSDDQPLFNRALRGLYSPGSTIKPMLAWVGLENRVISISSTINDPGYWIIPNKEERIYRDWKKGGHGTKIDVSTAIIRSCDPFFYELAYKMGIDLISENMFNFGFGQSSGIDMDEELTGIMPSREWKLRVRNSQWYPGETVITGIGQGYWNATPLQLVNSISSIATRGNRYQLRLLLAQQENEKWIPNEALVAPRQVDFGDGENRNVVRNAMQKVTQFPWGTAKTAFKGASYRSAGKTGTVQNISIAEGEKYEESKVSKRHRDNAVYVGYAPADSGRIAVSVVLENEGHGGEFAAPIARKVLDAFFAKEKR